MKINLFTNYYTPKDKERKKEIDYCYQVNQEIFDNYINFENRPKYNDFFAATQDYPNDVNILANADIYFNHTIEWAKQINPNQAYAITRWEIQKYQYRQYQRERLVCFDEAHKYNKEARSMHSQDVWVFRGAVNNVFGDFHMGIPGCDNRIAYEIAKAGYKLSNPWPQIQCIHKHAKSERNYQIIAGYRNNRVDPPYLWVREEGVQKARTTIR